MLYQPQPAHQRRLRGSDLVAAWQPVDGDGEPVDPAGVVTVTLTGSAGTDLVTAHATDGATDAPRTYTLPAADNLVLDRITATWSVDGTARATTYIDVVDSYLFPLSELRQFDGLETARFGIPQLAVVRNTVEDIIEWATGVAWRKRFDEITFTATGTSSLYLPPASSTLRRLTWNGQAKDVADYVVTSYGTLTLLYGHAVPASYADQCVAAIEHGYPTCPYDLRAAAIQAARYTALGDQSGISPRATGYTTSLGQVQYSRLDPERPFGIEDIDRAIRSRSERHRKIGAA